MSNSESFLIFAFEQKNRTDRTGLRGYFFWPHLETPQKKPQKPFENSSKNGLKMLKSSFQKPYTGGKTNFRYTDKRSGVYIIKKAGKIVYVGYSASNLYKTMYRHFQDWNDKTQVRVTYRRNLDEITVRVILCSPSRAEKLERALILKYKPKDNPDKLRGLTISKSEAAAFEAYESTPVSPTKVLEEAPF